jgi:hypothetical protein
LLAKKEISKLASDCNFTGKQQTAINCLTIWHKEADMSNDLPGDQLEKSTERREKISGRDTSDPLAAYDQLVREVLLNLQTVINGVMSRLPAAYQTEEVRAKITNAFRADNETMREWITILASFQTAKAHEKALLSHALIRIISNK